MGLSESYPAYGGRGPDDLRLGLGLGTLATILMILRVYVRLRVNQFGTTALIWSLVAWFLTVITQCFGVISVLHGLGNKIAVVEATNQLGNYLLFTWITVFFFNMAIPIGKVAVAAFLIEINAGGNPRIRKSLIAVAALNIILNIPQVLLAWFQCSPPSALWDPSRQNLCNHSTSVHYTYFVGAVAAVSDFYLAIIPVTMLAPLRIDRKLKWGLSFLMGLGVFAGGAAIVRTWAAKFIMSDDPSWGVGILFHWGEVEEWVVLISMSIPPVWPLFRPFTHRFIKSSASRSNPLYNQYSQYGSKTGNHTSTGAPPVVTTTISISSTKGVSAAAMPVGASSSAESMTRYSEEPETPHTVWSSNGDPEGWVEMSHYKQNHCQ
ncbi:uncharacterized protein N7443_004863 [Penicillium atrosanguineum]|uniref:uncharacterized protein n=1 Tax=Penicillium atrosanguineum TaxID=1132637 RepID=UPI00238CB6AC|nr:uncharacterized protein N7443_004863 [Penicillium atrosanguineum]KAJ5133507.1 hypothetical protein N7526_004872 [Penicillium atrosanguineum]KAJ5305203.1 hypothetical protein N7443_004863 [Penicillium atrosanguineum]